MRHGLTRMVSQYKEDSKEMYRDLEDFKEMNGDFKDSKEMDRHLECVDAPSLLLVGTLPEVRRVLELHGAIPGSGK